MGAHGGEEEEGQEGQGPEEEEGKEGQEAQEEKEEEEEEGEEEEEEEEEKEEEGREGALQAGHAVLRPGEGHRHLRQGDPPRGVQGALGVHQEEGPEQGSHGQQ